MIYRVEHQSVQIVEYLFPFSEGLIDGSMCVKRFFPVFLFLRSSSLNAFFACFYFLPGVYKMLSDAAETANRGSTYSMRADSTRSSQKARVVPYPYFTAEFGRPPFDFCLKLL